MTLETAVLTTNIVENQRQEERTYFSEMGYQTALIAWSDNCVSYQLPDTAILIQTLDLSEQWMSRAVDE